MLSVEFLLASSKIYLWMDELDNLWERWSHFMGTMLELLSGQMVNVSLCVCACARACVCMCVCNKLYCKGKKLAKLLNTVCELPYPHRAACELRPRSSFWDLCPVERRLFFYAKLLTIKVKLSHSVRSPVSSSRTYIPWWFKTPCENIIITFPKGYIIQIFAYVFN